MRKIRVVPWPIAFITVLVLLTLLLPSKPVISQQQIIPQPDCILTFNATATGRSSVFDNRTGIGPACTTWSFSYLNDGFSAVSIELDEAPSSGGVPGSWVTWPNLASGSLPLTATTSGQVTAFKYFPFVSINVNTATGSGVLRAVAYGYRSGPGVDSNSAPGSSVPVPLQVVGAAAGDAAQSGNPVLVAGVDNAGNVQELPVGDTATTAPAQTVIVGGIDSGGNIRQLGVSSQNSISAVVSAAAADGNSNTINWLSTAGGLSNPVPIAPFLFNGSTWDRAITCPNTTTFSVVSTTTQVIALSGSTKIRICSFDINPSTVTAGSTDIVYGTGSNCGTGTTTLTGAYTLPAAAVVDITPSTLSASSPLTTPAAQAVCVRAVTSTVNGFIVWEQH